MGESRCTKRSQCVLLLCALLAEHHTTLMRTRWLPHLALLGLLLFTVTGAPVATAQGLPDPRYFAQSGYRVDGDQFWSYFQRRGGVRTFGYPTSRAFTLMGCQVQFFQRLVMQLCPGGGVQPRFIDACRSQGCISESGGQTGRLWLPSAILYQNAFVPYGGCRMEEPTKEKKGSRAALTNAAAPSKSFQSLP